MVGIDMKMPRICIDRDGNHNCPVKREWCMQKFAPKEMPDSKVFAEMYGKRPSWCPLIDLDNDWK